MGTISLYSASEIKEEKYMTPVSNLEVFNSVFIFTERNKKSTVFAPASLKLLIILKN